MILTDRICNQLFIVSILLCCALTKPVGAQTHETPLDYMPPQDPPIYIHTEFIGESVSNLDGGLQTGTFYDAVLAAGIAVNSTVLGLPRGGRFQVSGIAIRGGQPSAELIGDAQVASNIEAEPANRLYEIWYRQDFSSLPLRFRLGIIDLNSYFNVTDSASYLLNSSFGISPALAANAPFSIYPKPGYGATLRYRYAATTLLLGVFDGNPESRSDVFNSGELSIAEFQQQLGDDFQFKLGGWQCSCQSVNNSSQREHTRGVFGTLEDTFKTTDGRASTLFLRAATSSGTSMSIPQSYTLGILYPSLLSSRPDDILSAGIAHAHLQQGGSETSYEFTYLWQFNRFINIQPDFQYIVNPAGTLPDAWVVMLRLNIFHDAHFD